MRIFYSWQSDLPNKNNRSFIEDCIKKTIKKYKDTITIEADRDVKNNTGSPDIANTIFDKIDECDLFIADVSIINKAKCKLIRTKSKPTPNPNVLLELGYAASVLGWDRVVCIYNTDYSELDALPFDLRQHRITSYSLSGKKKSDVRDDIVRAISDTIDGLINSGNTIRPKGTQSCHTLLGYDLLNNTVSKSLLFSDIKFETLKNELVASATKLVEGLNKSSINFTGDISSCFGGIRINFDGSKIIKIEDEEKQEVVGAVEKILGLKLQDNTFCFGNLTEKMSLPGFGNRFDGTIEEKQKFDDYLLLKRLLTEITILDLFRKSFDNVSIMPLAIQNTSKYLDQNINVTVTVDGDDFEIISPLNMVFDDDLINNVGFICEYGFIEKLFGMKETPELSFDDIDIADYYDDNPYINLWDNGTMRDTDDCIEVFSDYIASPSSNNILQFNIESLQANEMKWLSKVVLIRINSGNVKLKYSIKSDNTDGSVSGVIK